MINAKHDYYPVLYSSSWNMPMPGARNSPIVSAEIYQGGAHLATTTVTISLDLAIRGINIIL